MIFLKETSAASGNMRQLTVTLDEELEFITHKVQQLGHLLIRIGPDDILNLQRDMRQYKLRLEEMMEMTDCKES